MNLAQMKYTLQGQATRMQIMKSCEWLKEKYLDEIVVWGYDTMQDAGTLCSVWYNHKEGVWEGRYTTGVKSKWVSPFQVHQYLDKNFLKDMDETGVTLYKDGKHTDDSTILGGMFI